MWMITHLQGRRNPAGRPKRRLALPLVLVLTGCQAGGGRSQFGYDPSQTALTPETGGSLSTDAHRGVGGVDAGAPARLAQNLQARRGGTSATTARYDVTLEEIRGHLRNQTAVIIDARTPEAFSVAHVRSALNVPAEQKEEYLTDISHDVAADQFIIIYCDGPRCPAADTVYDYAAVQGFNNMRVFKPGWQKLTSQRDMH